MFSALIRLIRKGIWKVIGTDPQREYYLDLTTPRREMISYAVSLINHNTRLSREKKKPGDRGSLLGDYLEFGCYRGDSVIYAHKLASEIMPWMKFYAFDSFRGLPDVEGKDRDGPFWRGQFACTQKDFTENLKKAKVDTKRIECIPGWFDDTLTPELKNNKNLKIASIIYIDCDLYKSSVPVLRFITDIIDTGSIIMFDDWNSHNADPEKGLRKACSEWRAQNPHIILQDWYHFGPFGKSFIVKVK